MFLKRIGLIGLLFVLISSSPISAQVSYPFEELEGQDLSFLVNQAVDYTNYLEDSILVTVEESLEQSFSILDSGPLTEEGVWISGVEQIVVENIVELGILYDSGFNASSIPVKSANVFPFNLTIPSPEQYESTIQVRPVPFIKNTMNNITLSGNFTSVTPLIEFDPTFFVVDVDEYISTQRSLIEDYLLLVSLNLDIETDVFSTDDSFDYVLEGTMADIHRFTYHDSNNNLTEIEQFNVIDVSGGIFVQFGSDRVLEEFNINYQIQYEEILIMDYTYSVTVRPGSGGNVNIGDAGISPGWEFPSLLTLLVIIPIYKRSKRN